MGGWVGVLLVLPAVVKAALSAFGLGDSCAGEVTDAVIAAAAAVGLPVVAASKPIGKKTDR